MFITVPKTLILGTVFLGKEIVENLRFNEALIFWGILGTLKHLCFISVLI